jgi:CRP/FNR family transcriptional regulator, cyclic AMP receptor protein
VSGSRWIEGAELTRLVGTHPDLGLAITVIANERLRWANRRRVDFVSLTSLERLARVLVEVAEAYGQPGPAGVRVDVSMTQEDIASLAGQRLPTAQRGLRELEEKRLIHRGRRQTLITDLDGLRGVAHVTSPTH